MKTKIVTGLVLGTSIAWACADPFVGGNSASTIDFDRKAMLASISDNVVRPTLSEFATAADDLVTTTQAYADALASGSPDVADAQAAAQTSWSAAMDVWQRAEMMRVGPAGSSISAIAGEDLGDRIYSWPTTNACAVDEVIVSRDYEGGDFFDTALVNVYGLDALEYLLFYDSPQNNCPGTDEINAGSWDAIGDAGLARRRADYAVKVAGDVAATAHELVEAWDPSGGEFGNMLADPGENGSPYANAGASIDAVWAAMSYVDSMTQNIKIARPAGLDSCDADACPADLESPWAHRSRENALANLEGLRMMFVGGDSPEDGIGFDDFLVAAGRKGLGSRMLGDIDACEQTLQAMNMTFAEALAADTSALDPSYDALEILTDDIKGPFVMTLAITLPSEAAADGD